MFLRTAALLTQQIPTEGKSLAMSVANGLIFDFLRTLLHIQTTYRKIICLYVLKCTVSWTDYMRGEKNGEYSVTQ